MGTFKYKGKGS